MKKIKYIGIIMLVIFSFYYTDIATNIIKSKDPVMKKINEISNEYVTESVNAQVDDIYIKPGKNGKEIDINKTYENIKKHGTYNENLILYKNIIPDISIKKIYNKYINEGNKNIKQVSIVFVIENYNYIEEILNILNMKNMKATFFIDKMVIDDSKYLVNLINTYGNQIELYSDEYDKKLINKYKTIIKRITNKRINFCITKKANKKILENCNLNKMHTIIPSINCKNFPYSDIKRNIKNGSIISLSNNEETIRELKYILNYIIQKDYKIVDLNKLIEE